MSDATVVKLLQPGSFADPLTEVLRNAARALLAQAVAWHRAHTMISMRDMLIGRRRRGPAGPAVAAGA